MDDFLHNLRSGKLKQPDRSNRPYNDPQYKGSQRRNVMDRRKKEFDAFERLNAVKEVLETISETQKRMAEAYDLRTRAEERKARAIEVLAMNIYRMLNPDAKDVEKLFTSAAPAAISRTEPEKKAYSDAGEPDHPNEEKDLAAETSAPPAPSGSDKLTEEDRQRLFVVIGQMRNEGDNWEKIARHIAGQGFPTASGKGNWRGIMVKTLYEKMVTE